MDLNQKLVAAFQIEHQEHLEGIRASLEKIEHQGGAPGGPDLDEAFRHAHSLKGAARIIGLDMVEKLAHRLESLFADVRSNVASLDDDELCVIRLTLNAIEDCVAASVDPQTPPAPSRALAELDRLLGHEASPENRPAEAVPRPEQPAHSIPAQRTPDTVRLDAESLNRLLHSSGQLLTASLQQDVVARELREIGRQLAGLEKELESAAGNSAKKSRRSKRATEPAGGERSIDLAASRLKAISRRARGVRQLQRQNSWSLRLLAEQMQNDVCHARMVPANSVLQGFHKMMRDLAGDERKEIEFRASGFDVEADRAVLQLLKDPLMHVLRNSVSHGIETPRERAALGKSPQGLVEVRIEAVGNRLSITVEDDGRGVDLARVAEAAVERGILSTADAQAGSQPELLHLLFQPGFSTAGQVTELSGRGMGLSTVYEAVARLQGEVDIQPREGAGTVLRMIVPLSVSTHRLLLVSCGGQTFAIPLAGIETLMSVRIQDLEKLEGKPVVAIDGQLIPIATLAQLLELPADDAGAKSDSVSLVVLKSGARRVAAVVDALLLERDGLVQNLGPIASRFSRFLGGIFLEDGSVSLVLNPAELVDRFKPSATAPQLRPLENHSPAESTILVVDDSITTRTLETSILESHGYHVRAAVDGIDALEHLRAEKVDLVITDIQMPRLDGFGLLGQIKKDARLARIPVVVVSSMGAPEDQERGLNLGADAYIVKSTFDHLDLLQTIQQFL